MAGEAAVPLAEPVSSTSTTNNVRPPNETTTAATENQITVEDFAPGVVTESVQFEERTRTRDGKDQDPFVALSILDFGRSSQVKLPSPGQLANANKVNPRTQIHPTVYKGRPSSELPHATLSWITNAQSESETPKTKNVKKKWWNLGFRRFWRRKKSSKKFRSPDVSDKNVKGDSKESSGLDDDDKEHMTGDYSKEGSGLDDGDKQVTGDPKEGSKAGRTEDANNPAAGERRPLIDYQNFEAIQRWRSGRVSVASPDISYYKEHMTSDYSKEGSGSNDGDKQVTGDYKESSGLDDGDKQVTGDSKEEDTNNPATGECRPFIDYQSFEAIQQWRSGWVFAQSPDISYYSDVPAMAPFMDPDYSSPSPPPTLTVPSTPPPIMDPNYSSPIPYSTPTVKR